MATNVTISGAISGMDTAGLIDQLVSVQTSQQTLLKTQQSSLQKRSEAFASLITSLGSLSTQASALAKTSTWQTSTATSSSTAVTATTTGTASGSIAFDVTAVAAAHTLISLSTLGGTDEQAASGSLTLTRSDASTETIDVGSGSLADVVSGINNANVGLTAAAVQTAPGVYRLQVASTTTGADSSFTLAGLDGFTSLDVLTAGADATLHIGSNPATAYDITSPSNTFSSLVSGLSFTVSKLETGVTVGAAVDGSTVAEKISTLVSTVNGILSDIAAKTAYNTETKTGGVFTGQSTVRALQQNLLSAVSLTGAPGVQLTRDGKLTFAKDTFLTAFAANPTKVANAFGASSSFTAEAGATNTSVTMSGSLTSTRSGTYGLRIDQLAAAESWRLDPAAGNITNKTIALTRGGTTVSYTATGSDTLATAATAFNTAASEAGFGVTATVNGSSLVFTAAAAGSASAFSAALDGVTGTRVTEGQDIAGTIDDEYATGVGNVLSLPTGTSGAAGLSLSVSTTATDLLATSGMIGSFTYTAGLAQRLSTLAADATATTTGALSSAKSGADTLVKGYQAQIDAWDTRLTTYRESLTRQFTAMETALAKLKSATSAISQLTSTSSDSES